MKIDIIGDIHGCFQELKELLVKLGYHHQDDLMYHPENRQLAFVGDLTDRGPQSLDVIRFVYHLVIERRIGFYVPGNHCDKLYRYFLGNNVKQQHGLETTVAEYQQLSKQEQLEIKEKMITLYENAPLYQVFNELDTVMAHAGIPEKYIGRNDKKVKTFVLYGDITGEKLADGRPVRRDWAQHYQGEQWIVYGHTPVMHPRFVNKTVNIDTGCVFGNQLTAFRLPEEEIITVPSKQPFVEDKFRY
ncbi:bis(5'-nucleosyl)-tetraphosphatase PrpE [Gracilibacillus kekensis]|uniref:Protein phosphatase/bis(5'-nucleosyl)-tetraphosphatase (Symmetrical) n=1 Tax=Gracilibacillus kekensis TaxID=1027249 RepID=A0A1M7IKW0_9BACI|nr:bis(5'-nucleosyl)-tetraphosphatase PrpE [Gracilibacillus kekensis]SHM41248.1 protein phosphatase/bis(5'-nucleosyl)-tetraphosphatase (symmetrical) [Gracilibacillus kekensis]